MELNFILFFTFLEICLTEWVLLPSISPTRNKLRSKFSHQIESPSKNYTYENEDFCPDFHNLTTMSYGALYKEEIQSRSGWEISFQDVEELLKEKEKLPKSSKEKVNLVKQIGDNLMTEAGKYLEFCQKILEISTLGRTLSEKQVKTLFSPAREARTKDFHGHSMESALMTISMLLFGVYLSKLILKLLVSHYNRYNGGITMMTGIRAPITLTQGRRRRSTEFQVINLMHLINKYNTRLN